MDKIKQKLQKFSRGKSEEEGKLIKDDDDKKEEELDQDIIMKAVNTIGGKAFWFCMFLAYATQSLWQKSLDFQLKNMSAGQKDG